MQRSIRSHMADSKHASSTHANGPHANGQHGGGPDPSSQQASSQHGQHGQHGGDGVTIRIPALSATVERCVLITCRLDRVVARTLLPSALRPQLVGGRAVAGIYVLRLGAMRCAALNRAGLPAQIGWSPTRNGHCMQSMQSLQTLQLATDKLAGEAGKAFEEWSNFFDALPAGSAQRDSVLVMRDAPIGWSVPKETISQSTGPKPFVRRTIRSTLADNG